MTQLSETMATELRGAGFTADELRLDAPAAVRQITHGIRDQVLRRLRRRGAGCRRCRIWSSRTRTIRCSSG